MAVGLLGRQEVAVGLSGRQEVAVGLSGRQEVAVGRPLLDSVLHKTFPCNTFYRARDGTITPHPSLQ